MGNVNQARVLICRANPLEPDPRVEKIARSLQHGGYSVTTLGWDMGEADAHGSPLPTEETRDDVRLMRLKVPARFGRGLVNITHQLRWQAALLAWLIRHRSEYDLIHACDFDTILAALICKALYGKSVVYDIFDFYADMLRATPQSVIHLIRFVDLRAIAAADALILADDSRYQQIQGAHFKRSAVIYNCLQDQPTPPNPPVASQCPCLGITYVGNIQVERGLLELIEVLKKHPEWHLHLAGFGGDEVLILKAAGQLPNLIWHGRVPYTQSLLLNQEADVLIATYDPAIPNNRYASPNKVFEAMLFGKPIIVARGTNMDRIIQQADCGLVVEYGVSSSLEGALLRLQDDPELRARLAENARKAFESTYNWGLMEKRLLDLYQQLLKDK